MDHAWVKREEELVRVYSRAEFDEYDRRQSLHMAVNRLSYLTGRFKPDSLVLAEHTQLVEDLHARKDLVDRNLKQARQALYWHRNVHAFLVLKTLQSRHWSALPDAICREIVRFL